MESIKKYKILRIQGERREIQDDVVVVEYPFTIFVNGEEIITLFCTPKSLEALTVGFLYSEGYIGSMEDILDIAIDEKSGKAEVKIAENAEQGERFKSKTKASLGSNKGTQLNHIKESLKLHRVEKSVPIDEDKFREFMAAFTHQSKLFGATGGVHSCGLYDMDGMILFEDDIGRHNAYDKIFGNALMKGIDVRDKIVFTSGRISSEMLIKVARRNISMVVSKSAPMSLAIDMAKDLNITLIGFVRGDRMNIYTNIPE